VSLSASAELVDLVDGLEVVIPVCQLSFFIDGTRQGAGIEVATGRGREGEGRSAIVESLLRRIGLSHIVWPFIAARSSHARHTNHTENAGNAERCRDKCVSLRSEC